MRRCRTSTATGAAKAQQEAVQETEDPDLKAMAFVNWGISVENATVTDTVMLFTELNKTANATVDAAVVLTAINHVLDSNPNLTASVVHETTAYVAHVAKKVSPGSARKFLDVGSKLPATAAVLSALQTASLSVAQSTPVDGTSCFTSTDGSTTMSAAKKVGSQAQQAATPSCGGTQLNITGGIGSGIPFDAEVTVYSATVAGNPYNVTALGKPSVTPIVSFAVDVDGSPFEVTNLSTPITFSIPWTAPSPLAMPWGGKVPAICTFYNETTGKWSTDGVWVNATDGNTSITCATTHFTSFAGFQSSSSTVVWSLTTLLVVMVWQLLLSSQ